MGSNTVSSDDRDTAPLPAVPAGPALSRARLGGAAGALEGIAGLVSAGLLLVGVALVALQIVIPEVLAGEGLARATGPTWWRALVQLGVGAAGETLVILRPMLGRAARVWLSVGVILAGAAALWWCWWL